MRPNVLQYDIFSELIWKYVKFHSFPIPYMDPHILLRNHVDLCCVFCHRIFGTIQISIWIFYGKKIPDESKAPYDCQILLALIALK